MAQHLPDEYFRKRAAESSDVGPQPPERPAPSSAVRTVAAHRGDVGIATRPLIVLLVVLLASSYVLGRALLFGPTPQAPAQSNGAPPPVAVSTAEALSAFTDDAVAVQVSTASGMCQVGGAQDAVGALIDGDPSTSWRCPGDGVGDKIDFGFATPVSLVGLRLLNGNAAGSSGGPGERRIVSLKWTFPDGSFFVHGLAAGSRGVQEVRFPKVETSAISLEVLASAPATSGEPDSYSVSISSLEFLAPA